jgi:hypothetical protein
MTFTERIFFMLKQTFLIGALCLGVMSAQAQLAITETMSSASTNLGGGLVVQGPDFWELSNFGSSSISLDGYRFNDNDATLGGDADSSVFSGITIGPGESIIFVQSGTSVVTNRDDFIAWWGATNVPPTLQVLFYTGNGQSSLGDSIVLWDATATNDADYLDRADFGEATRGRSFTYDTNGFHGVLSTSGIRSAFKAVTSDDQGSPGTNSGPVTLTITQQPTPALLTSPASSDVTFSVSAKGMPRPRYQWRFQGVPIEGAIQSSLTLTNIQLTNAGAYSVLINNGLQTLTSSNAVLTVTTSPIAPIFMTTPKNANAFEGQTVQFTAVVNGSPTPAFQWQWNGTNLTGETSSTLSLFNVQSNQAGVYSVVASNTAGTITTNATLTVTAKPRLLITEVQSSGSFANVDWWELTSFESYPINLKGWRFDDNSHSVAPNIALTITNDLIIRPGESIVFCENYTPAQFRAWWPTMPSDVQVVRYSGSGIGLSSTSGDEINLWNAVTVVGNEFTERVTYYTFGHSPNGVSMVYDPENLPVGNVLGVLSTNTVLGLAANGMFTSTNGIVASPGRVVQPVYATNSVNGSVSLVSWNTVSNRNYATYLTTNIVAPNWINISNVTATGSSSTIGESVQQGPRYYRVGSVIPLISQP